MTTRADRAGLQIADVPRPSLAKLMRLTSSTPRSERSSRSSGGTARRTRGPHLALGPRGSMVSGVQR